MHVEGVVFVVDDNPLHWNAIEGFITEHPTIQLRCCASVSKTELLECQPKLVLINFDHSSLCACFLLCSVLRSVPDATVLCYSQAGVPDLDGICRPNERVVCLTYAEMPDALSLYIEATLLDKPVVRKDTVQDGGGESILLNDFQRLSPREKDIFCLFGKGLHAQAIADHFSSSVRTVETHLRNIRQKLRVGNGAELRIFTRAYRDVSSCHTFRSAADHMCDFREKPMSTCPQFS